MKKGDLVVELGDPRCSIGVVTGAKFRGKIGVRWHARCFRWVRRSDLRLANEQEVVSYNSLRVPIMNQTMTDRMQAPTVLIGLVLFLSACASPPTEPLPLCKGSPLVYQYLNAQGQVWKTDTVGVIYASIFLCTIPIKK